MLRVIIVIAVVALTIFATVEVAQADPKHVRLMPRWLWAFAVIVVPVIGPLAWLILGRPLRPGPQDDYRNVPRPPDDDPDFLRGL